MSEHAPKVILIDMTECIGKILQYTSGMNYTQYLSNNLVRDAVYRNLEVLGEAANRMPDYYIQQHPEIEWSKIVATRNAFIHGYDKINDKIVWNILQNILPDLKSKLEHLIEH